MSQTSGLAPLWLVAIGGALTLGYRFVFEYLRKEQPERTSSEIAHDSNQRRIDTIDASLQELQRDSIKIQTDLCSITARLDEKASNMEKESGRQNTTITAIQVEITDLNGKFQAIKTLLEHNK